MQMNLVISIGFIFGEDMFIMFLSLANDVILLELRPLIFVYFYTSTQSSLNMKEKVNILKNTRPSIIRKLK